MGRPTDWSALGLSGDPVRGDVTSIRKSATTLKSIATLIEDQATKLKNLSKTDGWDSDAGDKFHSASGDLATSIAKAKGRYHDVGVVLDTYADNLETVQAKADGILTKAIDAEGKKHTASSTQLPDKDAPDYQDKKDEQDTASDDADTALTNARREIEELTGPYGEWDAANTAAASGIRDAIDDDLTDSWWDHVRQAIHDARGWLNVIKEILETIGTILAVVALLILLCVPGANLFALAVIGLIIASMVLAVTLAQYAAGDASLGDVILAVVDVALSVVGVKAGKLLEAAGDSYAAAIKTSTRATVASQGGDVDAALKTISTAMKPTRVSAVLDELVAGGSARFTQLTAVGWTPAADLILRPTTVPLTIAIGIKLNDLRSHVQQIGSGETFEGIKDIITLAHFDLSPIEDHTTVTVGSW